MLDDPVYARLVSHRQGVSAAVADRQFLLQQAQRFRRLAKDTTDDKTHDTLLTLAEEYEARAEAIGQTPPIRKDTQTPSD